MWLVLSSQVARNWTEEIGRGSQLWASFKHGDNFEHQFNQLSDLSAQNKFTYVIVQCRGDKWGSPHSLLLSHLLQRCPHCGICISLLQMSRVWAHDSLPWKEGALWQKKKCFTTVSWSDLLSVLIRIDMFLKCCAKLKLNTWARPSRFKEPARGQRDGTGQQSETVPYTNWLRTNEICMHILSAWSPRLQWRMLFTYAFRSNNRNGRKFIPGLCWLLRGCAYIFAALPAFLAAW